MKHRDVDKVVLDDEDASVTDKDVYYGTGYAPRTAGKLAVMMARVRAGLPIFNEKAIGDKFDGMDMAQEN